MDFQLKRIFLHEKLIRISIILNRFLVHIVNFSRDYNESIKKFKIKKKYKVTETIDDKKKQNYSYIYYIWMKNDLY